MRAIPHGFLLLCTLIGVQSNIPLAKTRNTLALWPGFVHYRATILPNGWLKMLECKPTYLLLIHWFAQERQSRAMSRYTAIRTALIVAAALKPLLIMAGFLCLASQVNSTYLLVIMAGYLFISILPGLCVDPAVEEEAAQRRPDDGIFGYIRPLCIYFMLMWIFDRPEVRAFFSTAATRLWDWRPMAVVTIFCVLRLQKELRAALNFKMTDLYSCLNRREKSEAP